jgi:hypothetical protein
MEKGHHDFGIKNSNSDGFKIPVMVARSNDNLNFDRPMLSLTSRIDHGTTMQVVFETQVPGRAYDGEYTRRETLANTLIQGYLIKNISLGLH